MFTIRPARLPDDEPAFCHFILALQQYESAFEVNRRLDDKVAEEYLAELLQACARHGEIFVAEHDGRPVGWAVVHEKLAPVFVTDDERRHALLTELFVDEAMRGQGVGQALMARCEEWARAEGFSTIRIAHLAGNTRAGDVYRKFGFTPYSAELRKRL